VERSRSPGWLFCAAAVVIVYAWGVFQNQLLVDDAFIVFRYARNLATHGALVFNPGERVEGYSSLLFTLLLAPFPHPEAAAPVLGGVFGLCAIGVTTRAAIRLGLSPIAALAAPLLVATSSSFGFWAGAGLEAPLFALLVVWLATEDRPRIGAALAALLVLTRPEGVLIAAAVLGCRRAGRAPWIALLVALGAQLLFRRGYYGAWLPTPVLAKAGFGVWMLERGARYAWDYLWGEGALFLLPLGVIGVRREPTRLALAAAFGGYAAYAIAVGGDGLYRFRWFAHVVPCLALLVAVGLDRIAERWRPACLGAAVVAVLVAEARGGFFRDHSIAEVRDWEDRWTLVGQALRGTGLLATNVAGRVPYYSERPTLDLLGLTDRTIAGTPSPDLGRGYAGHERAAPGYVLGRAPEVIYFSVLDGLPAGAFRSLALDRAVLERGSLYRYAPLLADPAFRAQYAPALVRLADGRTANVFTRAGQIPAETWLE
jgi:arabinofuranosyltransferase